jgi:hypothetical protein
MITVEKCGAKNSSRKHDPDISRPSFFDRLSSRRDKSQNHAMHGRCHLPRKLAEHVKDCKLASAASATIMQITGERTSQEISELMLIDSLGGMVPGGILANRVNPIGLARAAEIRLKMELRFDNDNQLLSRYCVRINGCRY